MNRAEEFLLFGFGECTDLIVAIAHLLGRAVLRVAVAASENVRKNEKDADLLQCSFPGRGPLGKNVLEKGG